MAIYKHSFESSVRGLGFATHLFESSGHLFESPGHLFESSGHLFESSGHLFESSGRGLGFAARELEVNRAIHFPRSCCRPS